MQETIKSLSSQLEKEESRVEDLIALIRDRPDPEVDSVQSKHIELLEEQFQLLKEELFSIRCQATVGGVSELRERVNKIAIYLESIRPDVAPVGNRSPRFQAARESTFEDNLVHVCVLIVVRI